MVQMLWYVTWGDQIRWANGSFLAWKHRRPQTKTTLIKNNQKIKEKTNSISVEQRLWARNTKTPQVFADQPRWLRSDLEIMDCLQEQAPGLGYMAQPNNLMEKTVLQIHFTASEEPYFLFLPSSVVGVAFLMKWIFIDSTKSTCCIFTWVITGLLGEGCQ